MPLPSPEDYTPPDHRARGYLMEDRPAPGTSAHPLTQLWCPGGSLLGPSPHCPSRPSEAVRWLQGRGTGKGPCPGAPVGPRHYVGPQALTNEQSSPIWKQSWESGPQPAGGGCRGQSCQIEQKSTKKQDIQCVPCDI